MSKRGSSDWLIMVSGRQKGPVNWEELSHLAQAGAIHPRNDMVWQEGMEKWVAAGEIEGLFERRKADDPLEVASQMAATASNPGASDPHALGEDPDFHHDVTGAWPGVGRGGYIMATMVLPTAGQFAIGFIAALAVGVIGEKWAGWLTVGGMVALLVIALYAVIERFPNLGMTRWWTFGLLVPVLNWWLGYRSLACPAGYAYNKKLDAIGWVLAILYWGSVILSLVVLIVLIVLIGEILRNPEIGEKLPNPVELELKLQEFLKQVEWGS